MNHLNIQICLRGSFLFSRSIKLKKGNVKGRYIFNRECSASLIIMNGTLLWFCLIKLLKLLLLPKELQKALFQAVFHHCINDLLGNWIPNGVRYCAAAYSDFVSNVLLLPALEVKLNDLHVNRLQGLQWNVVGSGHGPVLLSISW